MALTVALMQLCDLPCIATSLDHIVVELVPESQSSELWARKFSKRAEIQSVDSERYAICEECENENEKIAHGKEVHVDYL